MANYVDAVMPHAKNLLDQVKLYEAKYLEYIFQSHPLNAVNLGLSFFIKTRNYFSWTADSTG